MSTRPLIDVAELYDPTRDESFAFQQAPAEVRAKMDCEVPVSRLVEAMREDPDRTVTRYFWAPALLMRAAMDSTVEGDPRVRLIGLATEVAIRAYAGQQDTAKLDEFAHNLDRAGLMGTVVTQSYDGRTERASTSELSLQTSKRIAQLVPKTEPILIVGIGHGGIAASIQTALWLTYLHRGNVQYRAYRHSRSLEKQYHDTGLHLFDAAGIKDLQEIAKGRTIVVHDEDATNGHTVWASVRQLRQLLPGARVIGVVNNDTRTDEQKRAQGRNWEN